jgi:hypothetical protein
MDNAIVEYSWKDVQGERPDLSDKKCKELFEIIFNDLVDALHHAGNEAIAVLIQTHEEQ